MPIYMKLGDIKGDVTAGGHEKWIELESCQFGMNRTMHMDTGRGGNRESSKTSVGEIVVTHTLDQSGGPSLDNTFHGQDGCEVTLDYVSTDEDDMNIYMQIKLYDTMISSYSLSSSGQRPMVAVSLNPLKIEYKYMVQEKEGSKATTPDSFIYDISKATQG